LAGTGATTALFAAGLISVLSLAAPVAAAPVVAGVAARRPETAEPVTEELDKTVTGAVGGLFAG
jgi:hypothetical protein